MSNERNIQHTLRHRLDRFSHPIQNSRSIIEAMLRRRGIREVKYTPRRAIILPEQSSPDTEDFVYRVMKKYSFRLFLRDLIRHIDHLILKNI